MALKQIMIQKKIEGKEEAIKELREALEGFSTREKELEDAIEEAETEEEQRTVEEQINAFTEERTAHMENIETAEQELEDLRAELQEIVEKTPTNREEKKKMRGRNKEELEEVRQGINEFVRSKGQMRSGFTSVEGGALIPEELLTPEVKPEDVVDLRNYAKVVAVNSASGKYPMISKSDGIMSTVEELAKNPELANPKIEEIDYKIATRRGYIPVSQEMIDDADYDVTGLIRDEINNQSLNTSNKDIAAVLKTATAKAVEGIDGLKDLVNKDIKKVYQVKFYISASLYAELDKVKDKNGRYLLTDSITAASGKTLLGREVIVLDDDLIGTTAGDLVGFVGDASAFIKFFDRKKTSVEWVDNNIYGKLLAGIVRYDVKAADKDAGFYITWTEGTVGGA